MTYFKKLLEERNMTQKDLARRSGVSISSIHKYANGYNQMTINNAFYVSMALGVDVGEFIRGLMNEL